jgi:hypothetical protein
MSDKIRRDISNLELELDKHPEKCVEIGLKLAKMYEKLMVFEGRKKSDDWDAANKDHPSSIWYE